jgi:predicted amidohydrolase
MKNMRSLNLILAQISPKNGDKSYNIHLMEQVAKDARGGNAELLVFPELSLTGYVCRDFFYQLAEPIDGPSVKTLCRVAEQNDLTIIFGMPLQGIVKGVLHNSAIMITPDGSVASYNKLYLPTHAVFEESRYFRPGNEVKTFEVKKCKVGLTICYDIYFPEIYRILTLDGAEVIFCIAASPSTRKEYFETLTRARALENGIILVFVNRVGIEDGLRFWGGSHIANSDGEISVKARYYDQEIVSTNLDLDEPGKSRRLIPTLKDLRPEVIDALRDRSHRL